MNSEKFDFQQLSRALGEPLGRAVFRQTPEDFQVDELFDIGDESDGEHLWLHIKKRDQNTQWVSGLLAKAAGVHRNDVSFSGMKDRFAVTTQWFSVHLPGKKIDLSTLEHPDYQILKAVQQSKKLRRGMHSGNRFAIVLRDVQADKDAVELRLQQIAEQGVPNYFGEQRFGHEANNLLEAERLVAEDRLKGNRRGNAIYLSAARSWLFNLVLASRVADGSWLTTLEDEQTPQGPLWGRGRSVAAPVVRELEAMVLQPWEHWCYALEHAGLKQERRDLQLLPSNLRWQWLSDQDLLLEFDLETGQFATSLLREIGELFRPPFEGL